ncbi:Uncharacterised protein [Shigella sonnei]|nr:Uncharacterised protein [Shigella sonnei]
MLPAIPQRFVGGANVSHCQAYQIVQTIFRLNFFGKLLDDFRVLNIAALCCHRHQQVLANQPGNQLCFA